MLGRVLNFIAMKLFRFGGFPGGLPNDSFGRTPYRFADTAAFAFDAVHEPARPDKFRGEKSEAKENHEPAWAGRDDHDYARQQQSKSGDDPEDAANLLNGAHDWCEALRREFEGNPISGEWLEHWPGSPSSYHF